jgi:hypothetical protein
MKNAVIITKRKKPPLLVQIFHKPNFLFNFSKKSVGGKIKGNKIVNAVNEIKGDDI